MTNREWGLKGFKIALVGIALVIAPHLASGQEATRNSVASYPAKPIRLVFPYPPGGGGDIVARLLGKKLNESWGQPVIVDNRPGASGMIGAAIAAKAAADGYTLLVGYTSEMAANMSLYSKMSYDPRQDFAPVSLLVVMPMVFVVHPSLPVKSVSDLIRLAQRKPGELTYASFGVGSVPHLGTEMLIRLARIQMVHVPYKGAGPAMTDIIAGHVCCGFVGLTAATPHIQAGKLRGLVVSTAKRSSAAPAIPTVAESGFPGFDFPTWLGLFSPAGTPRDIVTKLNAESIKAFNAPDAKATLLEIGAEPGNMSPEQMAGFVKQEIAKYANRASIVTGQYACRHGIIDNVSRDAASHRLPNYHLELQRLGYETAHIGKWHMGNEAVPRPGYDVWVSFKGHGVLLDPEFNENGEYRKHAGYITDLLNERAVSFIDKKHDKPWALFFAHKAVHPDAYQAPDGTLDLTRFTGYKPAERHRELYKEAFFPRKPNMLVPEEVVRQKPAWAEAFELKKAERSQALLRAIHAGQQEEIRLRAAMMASVDEGVGMIFDALSRTGQLDDTLILFLGDNGYFFGEHGLGPERRFAYEEGIRSPFIVRYPRMIKAGMRVDQLVLALDIAPTLISLAGGKPGAHVQGKSLIPLFSGERGKDWRRSLMVEYFSDNAMPWLVGMTYKAVRTERHKYIRWINRGRDGELDELYDLGEDPYELTNVIDRESYRGVREELHAELRRLVADAMGL